MKHKLLTEDDYREALARFIQICGAPDGSLEAEELPHLIKLMVEYEKENC